MSHGRSALIVLAALSLASSGCVSTDLFAKDEAQIDVRVTSVEQRVDEHAERLTTLETSVVQTADLAREAREHADVALARTDVPERRATPVRSFHDARDRSTARALLGSVHVLFGFNSSDLNDGAQRALLSVIGELRENPGLTLDLEGATDSKGSRAYNMQLSQRRVDAVRRYLLAKGILPLRILQSSAVGPLYDADLPEGQKRRVTVKLMKLSD